MIAIPDIEPLIGADAVDPDTDRIGRVSQVYIDVTTEQPTWVSVRTGLFGLSESLVPLDGASWDGERLHVGVAKARVKDAPRVDPDAEISPEEQERLAGYYGLTVADATAADVTAADFAAADVTAAPGASGPLGAGQVDLSDDYDAATMSETGYGAGGGLVGADPNGAYAAPGPRFDRGQSVTADEPRRRTDHPGYGEVPDEPDGPDVRASGRTAGDGRGSGDFASTGTALENDNPVAEEAAEGTGSGYGTSEEEDISGRFLRGGGGTAAGGSQRAGAGGIRFRRYVVRQETVPLGGRDDLAGAGMGPGMEDSSPGMRMDDQDPTDPGRR